MARLAERLTNAGLRVWFDASTLAAGEDIVAAVEGGLEHSRVLVFCMSRNAFASEWVRLERNTATFRDPGNSERRFLPLLFDDCTIPALVRRFKYIDWRNEAEESWQQLLNHLQPSAEPLPQIPREQTNPFDPFSPALGNGFVGRADDLRRLQQALETGYGQSFSVVGDRRIGKTSLLAAFAERASETGRIVRQMSGEGPEGSSLASFVRHVTGAADFTNDDNSIDPDVAADQLNAWAESTYSGGRPVLIIDESERLIETFEHRFFERIRGMLDRLMVVLCSRRELDYLYYDKGLNSPFYNTLNFIRVGLLEDSAIEELLTWGSGVLQPEDGSCIREWAGRHPYFVQLLASELTDARQNGTPVPQAIDRFCDTSAARLRDLWRTLSDSDKAELQNLLSGIPVKRRPLRLRGLVTTDGIAFGKVLTDWLAEKRCD